MYLSIGLLCLSLAALVGFHVGSQAVQAQACGTQIIDSSAFVELIDDGTWHSYSIVFSPYDYFTPSDDAVRVMSEDWYGGGPNHPPSQNTQDAFFDNVVVTEYLPIPTKSSTWGMIKALYTH